MEVIDLNKCKHGDILISCHGLKLKYIGRLPEGSYYDHLVQYPDGSEDTITNDGHVFKKNRLFTDHNIVKIIPC